MKKVMAIIRKEWGEVFKNKMVLFAISFMPLMFTALPLVILWQMNSAGMESGDMSSLATSGSGMGQGMAELCTGLTDFQCGQYILLTQFIMLFMMMPVIIPGTIASYSIVGEKTTRTLEPVLATPITTLELLGGKALAAIIPALVVTWLSFLVYLIGALLMDIPAPVLQKFLNPIWLLAVFAVGPLLAVTSVSLAIMVSSRTSDPRVAEQISALLVLPVVGFMIAQLSGFIFINQTTLVWIALGVVLLDALMLTFAIQLFQRETILTRWK